VSGEKWMEWCVLTSKKEVLSAPPTTTSGATLPSEGRQSSVASRRIPPGPEEKYDPSEDLLGWMDKQFKTYGDIYKASIYGTDVYAIRTPDYAQHVFRGNWQNYPKGGQAIKRIALLLGNNLIVSDGKFWKKQRRMMQPAFLPSAIGELTGAITKSNVAMRNRWEQAAKSKQKVNVTRDVSFMVLEVVLTALFGDDYEQAMSHFNLLSDEPARDLQFAQEFRSLGKFVFELVTQRREQNRHSTDILGMLMEARDRDTGEPMSQRQVVHEILTLIIAGHETTASTLNWAWYLLSQHPQVEQRISQEVASLSVSDVPSLEDLTKFTYTRQVLEEILRLYPALWLMTRRARRDDQLGDYFVPAGTEIYIPPYFIQRHPDIWENPNRFDPDRFDPARSEKRHPVATLPFSVGPRNCIGELLARVEMQIHLMTITKHLRLRYEDRTPPEVDAGINLRSKHDIVMMPELKALVD
jgi:cytochrome P450